MTSSKLALGCIADDYTGASDLANTLTRCGLKTVQTIGVPSDDFHLPSVDAVVIALKSRSNSAADAIEKSLAAERWLRQRGAAHVLFKICSTFDSTDAGNIGPVMEALANAAHEPFVLVTPAFPGTARTVYQGNLFVGALPLSESPLKDHPLNPMRDSNLVRVLTRQSRFSIGLIDLATVAKGIDHMRQNAGLLIQAGMKAAIVDAVFDDDLETIGAVALDHRLSVGASGLGLGLARALLSNGDVDRFTSMAPLTRIDGPAACLAGSCSEATLQQVAEAERIMPVRRLDPESLMANGYAIDDALAWADTHLHNGPVLIASSAAPEAVTALQARHGREAAGHSIEQALAGIAAGLVTRGVRKLVMAGGETSGAIVDRLALPGFLVGPEIARGVPMLQAIGSDAPMLVALKSGNFGTKTFFADALAMMQGANAL